VEWLDRFVEVMDIVSEEGLAGLGTSHLARRTQLSKGTLHRMLREMVNHGLLSQDAATRKYSLGPRSMLWGSRFLAGQDPVGLLREHCDLLAQRTGLYTHLCRFDAGQVYCVYTKQPSDSRNTYFVHVGQRMPLHCTAAAKAILAFQPPRVIESLFSKEPLTKFTEHTKTELAGITAELAEITRNRVAFCVEELEPGVSAIATPVFHGKGEVIASIGLIAATQYIEANREALCRELIAIEGNASAKITPAYLLASTKPGIV
jgi:DNA-binding IclR family transcriptional regulator